jgi:Domain of unknown function (DUF4336)
VTLDEELRQIDSDLWVAESPLRYLEFQMGRRMAVVRLASGGLLIHSPAPLLDSLRAALDALGEVRFVLPASVLHGHLYMEQYRDAYPRAQLFSVAGLERRRADLRFDRRLTDSPELEWRDDLDQAPFEGQRVGARQLNEIEYLHRKTRTLITGDLCFNIGGEWPLATRRLAWGPRMRKRLGPTTAFRAGIHDRPAARRSVERILEWDFDRILPGHGEIVESGGKRAFEEGLAWLLE